MHWIKGELLHFSAKKYKEMLVDVSPDDLWERDCGKFRSTCGSIAAVGCSILMIPPTMGTSTVGVALGGRSLYIARRKAKMVEAELNHRQLPHYPRKKRDILLPVGLTLTAYGTLAAVDIFLLIGSSSAVAADAAGGISGYVQGLFSNPGDFMAGAATGAELQAHQVLGIDATESLAASLQPTPVALDAANNHVLETAMQSAPQTQPEFASVTGGVIGAKAEAVNGLQQTLAIVQPGGQLEQVVTANAMLNEHGASGANPSYSAGVGAGGASVKFMQAQAAFHAVQDSGLDKVAKGINVIAGPPLPPRDDIKKPSLAIQALTGELPRTFRFLSAKQTPITQPIVTPPSTQKCQHDKLTKDKLRICRFSRSGNPHHIDQDRQAFYHCCKCSTVSVSYDICEVCVAGRGCGCSLERGANAHVLTRKGCLSAEVNFGKFNVGMLRKMKNKATKEGGIDVGKRTAMCGA